MKLEVTREIVSDLWPLYQSGDASPASRELVEAFLSQDNAFASTLRGSERLPGVMPVLRLSPDAERRLLDAARNRARMKWLVIGTAVALAGILMIAALAGILFLVLQGRLFG